MSDRNSARNQSRILVVFRKEFREIFRDKRTTFNIVISPLLLTPLIFALLGTVINRRISEAKKETVPVGIVNVGNAPTLEEALSLKGAPNLAFERLTQEQAEEAIKQRRLRAAVVLPTDAEQRFQEMRPVKVTVLLDEASEASQQAAGQLREFFREKGQNVVAWRLRDNGLSLEAGIPFETTKRSVTGGGGEGTRALAMFLPYVLAVSAILGGMYAANDSVAGEKERGTLETLLVSPASRRDLVMGKFLAVAGVSLVSSLLSVVGLLWPFYSGLPQFKWLTQGGLTLTPVAITAILLVQIPLAVFGAGLLLAVSTYARNQKEAQTYLGPVLMGVTVAAMLSMFLKAESGVAYALFPILNAALVLKQALEGSMNGMFIAVACVASLVYAALAVLFATKIFEKESVLLKA